MHGRVNLGGVHYGNFIFQTNLRYLVGGFVMIYYPHVKIWLEKQLLRIGPVNYVQEEMNLHYMCCGSVVWPKMCRQGVLGSCRREPVKCVR